MVCAVKDIIALKPAGGNTLKLYYASMEFPEGQMIARVAIGSEVKTVINK